MSTVKITNPNLRGVAGERCMPFTVENGFATVIVDKGWFPAHRAEAGAWWIQVNVNPETLATTYSARVQLQ
jgi:hypothetical protein